MISTVGRALLVLLCAMTAPRPPIPDLPPVEQWRIDGVVKIKLTQDQIDIVVDRVIPDVPPRWLALVESIPGGQVVPVDTVEESTPYERGWL